MPFSFNPRFWFKKRIKCMDNVSPSCYFSKSCSSSSFDNKDTETRIFEDKLFTTNKIPIKDKPVNVSVEVDNSIETHHNRKRVFESEDIAKSNPDSHSGLSKVNPEELTHVNISDETSIRMKTDYKRKEVCSCSNKTYSDCETQTEETKTLSNHHQEDLSNNKNCSSSFSLSRLLKCLKTGKTNFLNFGKKFHKKANTRKTPDMEQDFDETLVPLEINYMEIMRESDILSNRQAREQILSSDSGVDNSILSSFDSFITSESTQYDDSVLEYNQINVNRPIMDSVCLNSKTIPRNKSKSLKDISKSREVRATTGAAARNNYKVLNKQQFETARSNTNLNTVGRSKQNSTYSFSRGFSFDDELIFHFNTNDFSDDSSSSSDSDEVFFRPRKTNDNLDNGMQMTSSFKHSRNCNLLKNYYQSEEYIPPPPPSPENLNCNINNCSETLHKSYQTFDIHQLKCDEIDIDNGYAELHSKRFACPQYYSTNFSNEFEIKSSNSKDNSINSEWDIFRPDSYGSSGYESPKKDSRHFPKKQFQINYNDKTLSDTEIEYKFPMEFTKSEFNELRLFQMASGNSERFLYRSCSEPVHSEQFDTTKSKTPYYDYNLYGKTYFDEREMYPFLKNAQKPERFDYRSISRNENVHSNFNDKSLKEHLYGNRITPEQQISYETFSIPHSLSSLENAEIQVLNMVKNSSKFQPKNSPDESFYTTDCYYSDDEIGFHSRERSSLREKLPSSNTNDSEFTIFKFYGFIDGPLANTSPKRNL